MTPFDPDAAAAPGCGIFGLPHDAAEAAVVLVPAPFDATTSYRAGTALGPAAIAEASVQVDLFDPQTGRPWQRGIHMLEDTADLAGLSRRARRVAEPLIARGGARPGDEAALLEVDTAGQTVNESVHRAVAGILARGQVPGVVGGDHAVAFGGIAAAGERWADLGVLQVDAHADLRVAFEGFRWSHASIMDNVLREVAAVKRLVQVGVRDLGEGERSAIAASEGRVITHFDIEWQRRMAGGGKFLDLVAEAVEPLPAAVWVSFDVDGLDPALCPHTGTPVPGGLSFAQACLLLETVVRSGRRIVGFDLCEVAPGPGGDSWDAIVGARLLYKLCGFALLGA